MYSVQKEGRGEKTGTGTMTSPPRTNNTGIPVPMKTRFEKLSGLSYDDVRVHYNSARPVRLNALAYTQGNDVFVGPGQERHLSHELVHVAQQKSGVVRPSLLYRGEYINDDSTLERQADSLVFPPKLPTGGNCAAVQRVPGLPEGTKVFVDNSMGLIAVGEIEGHEELNLSTSTYGIRPDNVFLGEVGPLLIIDEKFVKPLDDDGLAKVNQMLANEQVVASLPNIGIISARLAEYQYPNGIIICPDQIFINKYHLLDIFQVPCQEVSLLKGNIASIEEHLLQLTQQEGVEFGLVQSDRGISSVYSGTSADRTKQKNAGVTIPKELTDAMKANASSGNIVVTHTHPASSPLSRGDVMKAVEENYQEIRAVGIYGVFSLKRIGSTWPFTKIKVFDFYGPLASQGIASQFPQYGHKLASGGRRKTNSMEESEGMVAQDLNHDGILVEHFAALLMEQQYRGRVVYLSPITTDRLIEMRAEMYEQAPDTRTHGQDLTRRSVKPPARGGRKRSDSI